MRAVLDPNVIISAVLAPTGAPARVLKAWFDGSYELVVSPGLLAELDRAFGYPKIRRYVTQQEAGELVELLRTDADMRDDPSDPPTIRSVDPNDDYLIALAEKAEGVIVSGDRHLLELRDRPPVYSPAAFLELLAAE